ncbi:MAG: hypothetical protein AAGL08_19025, partial [Cyanobacteria bacterium J06573_11]
MSRVVLRLAGINPAGVVMALTLGLLAGMGGRQSAMAEEITEWGYNEQTQVLTLTLPDDVLPRVSVVAPDQLLLELPDT